MHTIRKGDTTSGIAERRGVSRNPLDPIRSGPVLRFLGRSSGTGEIGAPLRRELTGAVVREPQRRGQSLEHLQAAVPAEENFNYEHIASRWRQPEYRVHA